MRCILIVSLFLFRLTIGFPIDQYPIAETARPVVIWHGLGDNWNSSGIHRVEEIFASYYPGIRVHSISLNDDPLKDQQRSMFGDANVDIEQVCDTLTNMDYLSNGFDAIGFSQGGVLMRALIERCASVKVINFISFGSPHMGVSELPLCDDKDWLCKRRNALLKKQIWYDSVQKRVIPAQYFRDPRQYDKYLEHSNLLADINNEREDINSTYTERFSEINKLVLVSFLQDTTVVPKQSSMFGDMDYFGNEINWRDTRLYRDDLIGLRKLDQAGKVTMLEIDDEHMRIPEDMIHHIAKTYINH